MFIVVICNYMNSNVVDKKNLLLFRVLHEVINFVIKLNILFGLLNMQKLSIVLTCNDLSNFIDSSPTI